MSSMDSAYTVSLPPASTGPETNVMSGGVRGQSKSMYHFGAACGYLLTVMIVIVKWFIFCKVYLYKYFHKSKIFFSKN